MVPLKIILHSVITGALSIILMLVLSASGMTHAAAPPAQAHLSVKPILLTDPVQDPKQDGVLWFPSTGHTLRGSFLTYWQQNGGLAQFGYPLTEEFFEPFGPDNKLVQVQYFERNRFEHHPENQPPYDVLLGTLGREFHPQDPPASQLPSPAIYFPETGHNLSGSFQQYWQAHGGLPIHGYPISEAFQENNPIDGKTYLVQYFERRRFELHPENTGGPYEVLLGLLGRQLSEKKGYPFGWYPLFGHAADWAWVSGYVSKYRPSSCAFPECGCTILQYGTGDLRYQLNDVEGQQYLGVPRDKIGGDFHFVALGREAQTGDPSYRCPVDQMAPIYLTKTMEPNPFQ